jgi:hypothetical protein
MQAEDYDPLPALNEKADGQGVAGVRIAPSNKDVLYASYHGYIWRSDDGGRSVRRTKLKQVAMPSNKGNQRLFNPTLDVHRRDAGMVIVGTYGEGAWYSSNGGAAWSRAPLPQPANSLDDLPGITLVLFDPSHPTRVYAFVSGVGLCRADAGPAGPFSLATGGPAFATALVAGEDGTIFLCEQTKTNSGKIWRYKPGRGFVASKPEHEAAVLAINPHRRSQVIICNGNGYLMESLDGGETFRAIGGAAWSDEGEVGWMGGLTTLFPAQLRFDPVVKDQIWVAQGVGVAKAAARGAPYRFEDWSAGIEELCVVSVLAPPGGKPIASTWDKPFWRLENVASYSNDFRYPVTKQQPHVPSLVAFSSFTDFAGNDPRFLVGVVAPSDQSAPGYSRDGGRSWQSFETVPETGWGYGGCIAASTTQNFILLPSNNATGVFTLNGGKSWAPVSLDGTSPTSQFANAFYVARKNIAADKTRPGTFALVYTVMKNSTYSEPLGGVWLTKDGGRSWVQVLKGVVSEGSHDPKTVRAQGLDERQFWQCQLDYVPGRPGELLYTPHADFNDDRFYWSRDDGRSWVEVHRKVRNVRSFGVGKAAPGQARPAVYFWGTVDRKEGLYATFDWFATDPKLVSRFPSQMLATVSWVAADPDRLGRVYIGTSCAGVVQADVELSGP